MSTRRANLTGQVLAAIKASELTMFEIAKRSGVDRSALWRFVNGKGGLTLESLQRLSPVIGIEIVRNPALLTRAEPENSNEKTKASKGKGRK